jgi:predicted Zn-ribbon and HTH transcriptional regulator
LGDATPSEAAERPSIAGTVLLAGFTFVILASLLGAIRVRGRMNWIQVCLPVAAAAWVLIRGWYKAPPGRPARDTSLCATCGYDLRATPDRCPECGTVANPRVPVARHPGATRIGRTLLAATTVVSAIVCVVACVQLVRSEFLRDMAAVTVGARTCWLTSGEGLLRCGVSRDRPDFAEAGWIVIDVRATPTRTNRSRIAASFSRDGVRLELPYWLIALTTSPLPVVYAARRAAARRRNWSRTLCLQQRTCAGCGYDLRATPERCPECGLVP